ncbi:MAG: hypothetical protein ACWA6U_17100 [Breznakibacter sp.]
MEQSEAQERLLNLGNLFVKELNLGSGVDTLSRWMSHYLAEKITIAEQSNGEEKNTAEKECFDVILKLWQHRHSLPSGRRPFENFEPILEYLSNLNIETKQPLFFYEFDNIKLSQIEIGNLNYKSVEEWIDVAKEIDKSARIWIEYALGQAAKYAENETTKDWIKNAIDLPEKADTSIIRILLDRSPSFDINDSEDVDFSKKYEIEKLKKRVTQLQGYSQLNEAILKTYEAELEKLL